MYAGPCTCLLNVCQLLRSSAFDRLQLVHAAYSPCLRMASKACLFAMSWFQKQLEPTHVGISVLPITDSMTR